MPFGVTLGSGASRDGYGFRCGCRVLYPNRFLLFLDFFDRWLSSIFFGSIPMNSGGSTKGIATLQIFEKFSQLEMKARLLYDLDQSRMIEPPLFSFS